MALHLDQPLTEQERELILNNFWRADPTVATRRRYEPYFEYYQNEMKALSIGLDEESQLLRRMAAKTHEDIRLIVDTLAKERDSDLAKVIAEVKTIFPNHSDDDTAIKLSIDLALRVWLLLNVREPSNNLNTVNVGNMELLCWTSDTSTLQEFVNRQFLRSVSPAHDISVSESRLDGDFTAYNLNRLYNITIQWTHSLADHLRFDLEDRVLHIFPYRICLYDHGMNSGSVPG